MALRYWVRLPFLSLVLLEVAPIALVRCYLCLRQKKEKGALWWRHMGYGRPKAIAAVQALKTCTSLRRSPCSGVVFGAKKMLIGRAVWAGGCFEMPFAAHCATALALRGFVGHRKRRYGVQTTQCTHPMHPPNAPNAHTQRRAPNWRQQL
jgi:hypothetical protein